MPKAVLGIDIGTTSTKAGLFDLEGNLLAFSRADYAIRVGAEPGWFEQGPEDWWNAVLQTINEVATASDEIVALCCDGQFPTLVAVDDKGQSVCPAILWMDTRSFPEHQYLSERLGEASMVFGNLPKVLWLKRHRPQIYQKARWFFDSWDYIAFRLSGRAATSFQYTKGLTLQEQLEYAGIEQSLFPSPIPTGNIIGELTTESAAATGLPAGVPVVAGVFDGMSSCIGAGLIEKGRALDIGGTSGGFSLCWDSLLSGPGVFGLEGPLPNLYISGGVMAATGKALDWLRDDILGGTVNTEELLAEAARVPAGAEGLVFLPYLAGERSPLWDPMARGVFVGLTLRHQRAHLARAVFEGAAFAVRHVAESALQSGASLTEMRVCGGTARSRLWNQIKADVTGFSVAVMRVPEVAVLGAAILAAVGVEEWPDLKRAVERMAHVDYRLEPQAETKSVYDRTFNVYKETYLRLSPVFHDLAAFN